LKVFWIWKLIYNKNKVNQMLKRFNELNSTTYLSASHKALGHGQPKRSMRLSNYVFHEFIGKELNNSKIENILCYNNALSVKLLGDDIIFYDMRSDNLKSSVSTRKDAVLLSKIILKLNPESKYKNVNNIKIDEY